MKITAFLASLFAFLGNSMSLCTASDEHAFVVSTLSENCKIEIGDIPPDESPRLVIQIINDTDKDFSLERISKQCGCVQIEDPSHGSIAQGESLSFDVTLIRQKEDETNFKRQITLVSSHGDYAIHLDGTFRQQIELQPLTITLSGEPQTVELSIRTYPERMRESLAFKSVSKGVEVTKFVSGTGKLFLKIRPDELELNGISQRVAIDALESGLLRQRLTLTVFDTTKITVRPDRPIFTLRPDGWSTRLFVAGIDLSKKKDLEIQIVKPDGRILKSQPTIEIRSVSDRLCIVDLTRCGSELRDFDAPLISITSEAIGLALELPCRIKENVNDSREQTAIP